jgi:hypothetical protein
MSLNLKFVILGLDPGIQASLFFKDNGFPITTSGMTTIGHGLSSAREHPGNPLNPP